METEGSTKETKSWLSTPTANIAVAAVEMVAIGRSTVIRVDGRGVERRLAQPMGESWSHYCSAAERLLSTNARLRLC